MLLASLLGCVGMPEHHAFRDAGSAVEIEQVPFFPQEAWQCGPAALATVLQHAGVKVTPEALEPQMFIPERRGSLQAELIAATRRQGRVPYRLPDALEPMLEELRAGRPVLVFQNLGFERYPVWHYAVLVGFDPEQDHFLLRSGTERRLETRGRAFLASWARADRWSMVVTSPAEPPASADALAWLQAVAPFESTGDLDSAARGYEAAVARWPETAATWTALGNIRYREGRLRDAEAAYEQALARAPEHWTARNNLIRTLVAQACPARARIWIEGAGIPPPELADHWAETLHELAAIQEDGNCP